MSSCYDVHRAELIFTYAMSSKLKIIISRLNSGNQLVILLILQPQRICIVYSKF